MSSLLTKIADAFVMRPSRKPMSGGGKQRLEIPLARGGSVEVWTHTIRCEDAHQADVYILKFAGTSGRAERSTYAPLDHWTGLSGHVWSVNPPGYGGSTGRCSMRSLVGMADAVYESLRELAGDRPIVVCGNSLGTVTALYLAARYPVAGLVLRNPPPLRQLIVGQHGWWNLWIGAALIATQVPSALCSIRNAQRSQAPAVFVTSRKDSVVPRPYQQRVVTAYSGPKKLLTLRRADHHTPLTPFEHAQYGRHLSWLRQQFTREPMFESPSVR